MIENMEIKVSNVQFLTVEKEQQVNIHFRGVDPNGTLNINGYVPATMDEYNKDASLEGLSKLVKEKVLERLK